MPSPLKLVIRTYNTKRVWPGHSSYPIRLQGVAKKFFDDWNQQIGLIGMQEVREDMTDCPYQPANDHGTDCFDRIMTNTFNQSASHKKYKSIGIVVGDNWEILSRETLHLGRDAFKYGLMRSHRRLLGVKVRHRSEGWKFRFYTTHLSHADQEDQRKDQINKIIDHVTSKDLQNELPPIIAGDFNFYPSDEHSSYNLMNKFFQLIFYHRPDHIWMGRSNKFPGTRGQDIIYSSGRKVGLNGLSDHDSPRATFRVGTRIATRIGAMMRDTPPWLIPR